jgi:hypothetical protein
MRRRRSVTVLLHHPSPGAARTKDALRSLGEGGLNVRQPPGPRCHANFAREVFTDAWLSSKQREPARYRPRAPIGPRRSSGRVGLQNRPGGCESLRTCQFSRRLGRSSDGAWLKTTRARRATASLHHSHSRKRRVRRRSHKPALFRATRNPAPIFFRSVA